MACLAAVALTHSCYAQLQSKYLYTIIADASYSKQSTKINSYMGVLEGLDRRSHIGKLMLLFHAQTSARRRNWEGWFLKARCEPSVLEGISPSLSYSRLAFER